MLTLTCVECSTPIMASSATLGKLTIACQCGAVYEVAVDQTKRPSLEQQKKLMEARARKVTPASKPQEPTVPPPVPRFYNVDRLGSVPACGYWCDGNTADFEVVLGVRVRYICKACRARMEQSKPEKE